MPKTQPSKDKFWVEMEALLQNETPGPEWFSTQQLAKIRGRKNNGYSKSLNNNPKLEVKKFLVKGKYTNYYRVKK